MALEHRKQRLLSRRKFLAREFRFVGLALCVIAISLGIGVVGYRYLFNLPWVDALLNASMILTGMGPVNPAQTTAAKLFASIYAIFSGVVFLVMVGIMMTPLFHRFLHRFHLDLDEEQESQSAAGRGRAARPKWNAGGRRKEDPQTRPAGGSREEEDDRD